MSYDAFYRVGENQFQSSFVKPTSSAPNVYDSLRQAIQDQQHFTNQFVQSAQSVGGAAAQNTRQPFHDGAVGGQLPVVTSATRPVVSESRQLFDRSASGARSAGIDSRYDQGEMSPRTRAHQQQWQAAVGPVIGSSAAGHVAPKAVIGVARAAAGEKMSSRSLPQSETPAVAVQDPARHRIPEGRPGVEREKEDAVTTGPAAGYRDVVPLTGGGSSRSSRLVVGWLNDEDFGAAEPPVGEGEENYRQPVTAPQPPAASSQGLPAQSTQSAAYDRQHITPEELASRSGNAIQAPVGSQAEFDRNLDEQYRFQQQAQQRETSADEKGDRVAPRRAEESPQPRSGGALDRVAAVSNYSASFFSQQQTKTARKAQQESPVEEMSHRHLLASSSAAPASSGQLLAGARRGPATASRASTARGGVTGASSVVSAERGGTMSATRVRSSLHDATTRMVALNQTLLQLTETHKMLTKQSEATRVQIAAAEAERQDTEHQYQALCGSLKQALQDLSSQLSAKQLALREAREINVQLKLQLESASVSTPLPANQPTPTKRNL
jgi:hypothetical protein